MTTQSFNESTAECPECGYKAPKQQIENMGECERCSLDGQQNTQNQTKGKNRNPDTNLVDRYKLNTWKSMETIEAFLSGDVEKEEWIHLAEDKDNAPQYLIEHAYQSTYKD